MKLDFAGFGISALCVYLETSEFPALTRLVVSYSDPIAEEIVFVFGPKVEASGSQLWSAVVG